MANLLHLSEVTEFIKNGLSVKQDESAGGLPITRIETISHWEINPSKCGYAGLQLSDVSDRLIKEGDILFSHINSLEHLGKTAIYEGNPPELVHGMNLLSIRPNKDKVEPRYLLHLLRSKPVHAQVMRAANKSVNQASVSATNVKKIQVNIPELEEQKRIAKILDAADALRAKRRESLAQLDALLQSTFHDLFGDLSSNPNGWELMKFSEIAKSSFRNGLSPSNSGNVPGKVLTLSAITSGLFDSSFAKEVFFDREPSPAQYVGDDVFMICRGNGNKALVGVGVFGSETTGKCVFPDTIIAVNPVLSLLQKSYLQMVWRSEFVRQQIERGARTTNGTFKVNQELLKSVNVPVPPMSIQAKYDALVGKAMALREKSFRHLKDLDDLFISLQSRAFSGEL